MRTRGSSSSGPAGISGGGGGSGSGSSLGGRGCAAAALAASTSTIASKRRIETILQVQEHLALLRRRLEAALLVEREDRVDHLLRLVAHLQEIQLQDVDHALRRQ